MVTEFYICQKYIFLIPFGPGIYNTTNGAGVAEDH